MNEQVKAPRIKVTRQDYPGRNRVWWLRMTLVRWKNEVDERKRQILRQFQELLLRDIYKATAGFPQ